MIYEKGGFYHLYNRGCNKEQIFKDQSDYANLVNRISASNFHDYLNIISYCLMPNHYHFLLKQKTGKYISDWIRHVFNGYSQYFNHKYSHSGTIFEGRVKAKMIADEKYLIRSSLYIHYNPVSAGLVKKPEEWEFSNYREWISIRKSEMIYIEFIKSNFDTHEDYISLMKDYVKGKIIDIDDFEFEE